MFASKPKPMSSPSRVSIEEANSHLKLVHQRVEQLEAIVTKRDQQLIQTEETHRQEVHRLSQSYDKHCKELNREIDFLKNKIKDLEIKVVKQNEIIVENEDKLEKWSQIGSLAPNLDKLLKLLNGLIADKNVEEIPIISNQNTSQTINCNNNENIDSNLVFSLKSSKSLAKNDLNEKMNGFHEQKEQLFDNTSHSSQLTLSSEPIPENGIKLTKKSVKYKPNDLCLNSGAEEEVVSTTSTSTTTSVQSPSANSIGGQTAVTAIGSAENFHRKSLNSKLRIGRSFNITANFSDDEELVSDRRPSGRRKKVTQI